MDWGTWWATVHEISKSQTGLSLRRTSGTGGGVSGWSGSITNYSSYSDQKWFNTENEVLTESSEGAVCDPQEVNVLVQESGGSCWNPLSSGCCPSPGSLQPAACVRIAKTTPAPGSCASLEGLPGPSVGWYPQLWCITGKGRAQSAKGKTRGVKPGEPGSGSQSPLQAGGGGVIQDTLCSPCEVSSTRDIQSRLSTQGVYWGAGHVGTLCLVPPKFQTPGTKVFISMNHIVCAEPPGPDWTQFWPCLPGGSIWSYRSEA